MKSKRTTPIANANDPIEAFRKMAYWFHNRGWACFLSATPNREPYVMAHTDGEVASALIVGQVDGQTKTMNFKVRLRHKQTPCQTPRLMVTVSTVRLSTGPY